MKKVNCKTGIPMQIRRLRAYMELKALSLRDVSERAGLEYSVASAVLTGRLRYESGLERIRLAIEAAPSQEPDESPCLNPITKDEFRAQLTGTVREQSSAAS